MDGFKNQSSYCYHCLLCHCNYFLSFFVSDLQQHIYIHIINFMAIRLCLNPANITWKKLFCVEYSDLQKYAKELLLIFQSHLPVKSCYFNYSKSQQPHYVFFNSFKTFLLRIWFACCNILKFSNKVIYIVHYTVRYTV